MYIPVQVDDVSPVSAGTLSIGSLVLCRDIKIQHKTNLILLGHSLLSFVSNRWMKIGFVHALIFFLPLLFSRHNFHHYFEFFESLRSSLKTDQFLKLKTLILEQRPSQEPPKWHSYRQEGVTKWVRSSPGTGFLVTQLSPRGATKWWGIILIRGKVPVNYTS